jgi:hypothetical protein
MREHCNQFGRSVMSKGNRASAFFLSRGWRKETESQKFLEGKIKARSRKRSQVIVCTSFFRETDFCRGRNCEILSVRVTLFCGFDQSPAYHALATASLP